MERRNVYNNARWHISEVIIPNMEDISPYFSIEITKERSVDPHDSGSNL